MQYSELDLPGLMSDGKSGLRTKKPLKNGHCHILYCPVYNSTSYPQGVVLIDFAFLLTFNSVNGN